jgi:transposase
MQDSQSKTRRRHSADLKAQVLTECAAGTMSVAQVAMAHGLNANLVHKWRRQSRTVPTRTLSVPTDSFIPLTVPPTQIAPPADIRITMRRGSTSIDVAWPLAGAAECAAWLRELVR